MNSPLQQRHEPDAGHQFEPSYRQHYGFVQSVLARFGVPAAMLDDVAQQVFISAYRNWDRLESNASVRAFLYAYARGCASNYRKKAWREQRKLDALVWSKTADKPLQAVEALAARHTITKLLELLPEANREAFVLSELWGMKATEIAALQDTKVRTVRTRIQRAHQLFRVHVSELSGQAIDAVVVSDWLSLLIPDKETTRHRAELGLLLLLPLLDMDPVPPAANQASTWSWLSASAGLLAVLGLGAWSFGAADTSDRVTEPVIATVVGYEGPEDITAGARAIDAERIQAAALARVNSVGRSPAKTRTKRTVDTRPPSMPPMPPPSTDPSPAKPDSARQRAFDRSQARQVLTAARQAVFDQRPGVALQLLDRLDLKFPLASDDGRRLRWRIEALCQLDGHAKAQALAARSRRPNGSMPAPVLIGLATCRIGGRR